MSGISVTLEGDTIQLAFQKGSQTTAVVMDASAAQSLARALDQLLVALREQGDLEPGDLEAGAVDEEDLELYDVTSSGIDVGVDEGGQAVLSLQAGPLPHFLLRLKDEEARHVAQGLLEILDSPQDVRASQGGH